MKNFLEEPAVDEPVCSGNWTEYYNRDLPGGVGDFETLASLRRENPGEICDNPTAVDARVVGVHTHYSQTGENVGVSLDGGFYCENAAQPDGNCMNYEVRFCCNGKYSMF